jgi:hypothetical protein
MAARAPPEEPQEPQGLARCASVGEEGDAIEGVVNHVPLPITVSVQGKVQDANVDYRIRAREELQRGSGRFAQEGEQPWGLDGVQVFEVCVCFAREEREEEELVEDEERCQCKRPPLQRGRGGRRWGKGREEDFFKIWQR